MNKMDIVNEILNDKELAGLVSSLSKEEFDDNILVLYKQHLANINCKNCKGKCKSDPEYMVSFIKNNNGVLYQEYCKCKYRALGFSKLFMPDIDVSDKMCDSVARAEVLKKMIEVRNGKRGIYLHGTFGCGKTYLMYRLALDIAKSKEVVFVYYPELINNIKASISKNDSSYEKYINVIKNAQVLFLDDVGREFNTVFNRDQILGTILQYRCMMNLQTFMTSNYDIKMLKNHLSETKDSISEINSSGIIERILSLMEIVQLDDKNYR